MKRLITILLVLSMLMLVSCNSNNAPAESSNLNETFEDTDMVESLAETTNETTTYETLLDVDTSVDTTTIADETTKVVDTLTAEDTTVADETTFVNNTSSIDTTVTQELPITTTDENLPDTTIPNAYIEVIKDYKDIVEYRLTDIFRLVWDEVGDGDYDKYYNADIQGYFGSMFAEMIPYGDNITLSSYGYVLNDINLDGTPELFWVSSDCNIIFAIFTIVDGEARLLDVFWSRYKCCILDDGVIYTLGSGGAANNYYEFRTLDGKGNLIIIKKFWSDYDYINDLASFCYIYDGNMEYITKEKYDELIEENPFPSMEKVIDGKYYSLAE